MGGLVWGGASSADPSVRLDPNPISGLVGPNLIVQNSASISLAPIQVAPQAYLLTPR